MTETISVPDMTAEQLETLSLEAFFSAIPQMTNEQIDLLTERPEDFVYALSRKVQEYIASDAFDEAPIEDTDKYGRAGIILTSLIRSNSVRKAGRKTTKKKEEEPAPKVPSAFDMF